MASISPELTTPDHVRAQCEQFRATFNALVDEIGKVMVGHRDVV